MDQPFNIFCERHRLTSTAVTCTTVTVPPVCPACRSEADSARATRLAALESLRAEQAARPCERNAGEHVDTWSPCGACLPCRARALGKGA